MSLSLGTTIQPIIEWCASFMFISRCGLFNGVTGEKTRIHSCCSRPVAESEGCVRGPHVFYESKPEDLHSRHGFSFTRPSSKLSRNDATAGSPDTALEVASLDCEMIYTTGGMRVARVSIVDGSGTEVFDEFVRMDDGVEVTSVSAHQSVSLLISMTQ